MPPQASPSANPGVRKKDIPSRSKNPPQFVHRRRTPRPAPFQGRDDVGFRKRGQSLFNDDQIGSQLPQKSLGMPPP